MKRMATLIIMNIQHTEEIREELMDKTMETPHAIGAPNPNPNAMQ